MPDDPAISAAKEITIAIISKIAWGDTPENLGKDGGKIFAAAYREVLIGIDEANKAAREALRP